MVQFRHAQREIQFKTVFYGPALGGKTTTLEALHDITDAEGKSQVVSLKTSEDRTLFFDFMPFDLGEIQGYHIRFQVFTVPGQVHYNTTRKVVLAGSDAILFVADSQKDQAENNYVSWENMRANLLANKMDLHDIPVIVQCNKQDLPDIMDKDEVLRAMRLEDYPATRASALTGDGVVETFLLVAQRTLAVFVEKFRLNQKGITPEKIAEGVYKVFEEYLGKRRPGLSLPPPTAAVPGPLVAHVPVKGLTEEEQLVAALESSTQLAERYQDAQLLSRKYEERLREMTTLYEVGAALAQVNSVREALSRIPEVLSRFREGWVISSFLRRDGSPDFLVCVGSDKDPLWVASVPGAGNLAVSLFQRGTRVHVKDLQQRFERFHAQAPEGLSEAVGLTLGEAGRILGHLILYCTTKQRFGLEEDRFFSLLEQVVVPRLLTLALMEDLSRSNDDLERKVIERTGDLNAALERLKELDHLKQTFLNNISHEVRTPLTTIRSYSDILIRYPASRDENLEEYLGLIVKESIHLENLFEGLLSYSEVKTPTRGEAIDLSSPLQETLRDLEDEIGAKQINLQYQGTGQDLQFPMNREDALTLFRQVLDNAVKFSPEGERLKVYLLNDPKKVIFAVRDYGPGIPKEQMDRFLLPFEPGQPEVPDFQNPGLGMGLFLIREVVRKYGGHIHVENMSPGTNVMVEFPKESE